MIIASAYPATMIMSAIHRYLTQPGKQTRPGKQSWIAPGAVAQGLKIRVAGVVTLG
jgi:hypothetical protein